ncbi:MAG: MFS transporter [Bordetella sp.]|nr:MAG: MFS transporter [Bordetella sp.]
MRNHSNNLLNSIEKRASFSLALLFACRMFGLFLLLPVFTIAIYKLPGSDSPFLVGLAVGIYGLMQAIMQIPFGLASDYLGRRKTVAIGLLLFIIGSSICALAENVLWLTIGRTIQGTGAISSVITAWLSDVTRQEVRTRAMAIIGSAIGISFVLSITFAPFIISWNGLPSLFWITSCFGVFGLIITFYVIPVIPNSQKKSVAIFNISTVFLNKSLLKINIGVFILHFILTLVFLVMPKLFIILINFTTGKLWKVYLPIILLSFIFMIPIILLTEKYKIYSYTLRIMIASLACMFGILPWTNQNLAATMLVMIGFFTIFNVLEALQPSLLSILAPENFRGLALGIYNTSQSIGLFLGGFVGGYLITYNESLLIFFKNKSIYLNQESIFYTLLLSINSLTIIFNIAVFLSIFWLITIWTLKIPSKISDIQNSL